MSDWKTFLEEGRQFHRTAKGSVKRPDIFTPVIVQNIAAMAIEKYFMALFLKRGVMPLNHTILDLCSSAVTLLTLPPHLLKVLAEMDGVQQICSLEHFRIIPPSPDDVLRFLKALDETAVIVLKELNETVSTSEPSISEPSISEPLISEPSISEPSISEPRP